MARDEHPEAAKKFLQGANQQSWSLRRYMSAYK
jgi:hypothetical protein